MSDADSYASDPGGFSLSHEKLREMRPDLYGFSATVELVMTYLRMADSHRVMVKSALQEGDCRGAVVVSVFPLIVASYTDEMDCVVMLRFPDSFVQRYRLQEGTRLLSVNTYATALDMIDDLVPSAGNTGAWTMVHPLIAEFVSDDYEAIEAQKRQIATQEWNLAYQLGKQALQQRPGVIRDGRPGFAGVPAAYASELRRGIEYDTRRHRLFGIIAISVLVIVVFCGGLFAAVGKALRNRRGVPNVPPAPAAPNRGVPDRGVPDRGVPDRGVPDRGVPDRGVPDRDVPDRDVPDRDVPDRDVPDRDVPDPANRGFGGPGIGDQPDIPDDVREAMEENERRVQEIQEEHRQRAEEIKRRVEEGRRKRGTGSFGGNRNVPSTPKARDDSREMRTWLDASGQHRTEARLVDFRDEQVTLIKSDGKTITLPLASLSAADQAYVRSKTSR